MYSIPRHKGYLFSEESGCLEGLAQAAIAAVRSMPDREVLEADPSWLAAKVFASLDANPLTLGAPVMERPRDVEVDVSGDSSRYFSPGSRKVVRGLAYRIKYPISGFRELAFRRPSTFSLNPPRARIEGFNLVYEYEYPGHDHAAELKQRHADDVRNLKSVMDVANADLAAALAALPGQIQGVIEGRQAEIRKKDAAAAMLGIPLDAAQNPQQSIGRTLEQYRHVVVRPAHRDPAEPVPSVEYDGILGLIEHVGRQWELYPANTQRWGEDEFRNSILGYLNLPYKGQATGETFIRNGKSDILIRDDGVEVFIAECKIWGGQAQVHSELDQLFTRYQTWRATTSALIYFNRGKNTTEVMENLRRVIPSHSAFVSATGEPGPTQLRYRFRHPTDQQRIFDLAVLVFAIVRS